MLAKRITGESVDEVKREIEAGAERLRADLLGLLETWGVYHARAAVQSRNIDLICESATDVHLHTTALPQEVPQEQHIFLVPYALNPFQETRETREAV
jgi:hypothetical protein